MKIKLILLSIVVLSSFAFAQHESVGLEYNHYFRHLDSLRTQSTVWGLGYRYELSTGTRFAFGLGLNNVNFYYNDTDIKPILESKNQVIIKAEAQQKLSIIYFRGGVYYYKIFGWVGEVIDNDFDVFYENEYRIVEFPLSAGLTIPIMPVELSIGLHKVFFYGTNYKDVIISNQGSEYNLGSEPTRTFIYEFSLAVEANIAVHLSDALAVEVNYVQYKDNDFAFRFSFWGPLERLFKR